MKAVNRNTLWANIFVSELIEQGLQSVCVAAGSRSTPLTLAFAAAKEIQLYSHIDERSAAFFALGMARASQKPAALVCTSGTAAANFYPAVIEANYSETPVIVLTADRPHELRDSGSNQSIDQVRLYGEHVRWFFDVMPPEARPSKHVLSALKVLAARAWMNSQAPLPGPVHLNFPFRKPLEQTDSIDDMPDWMTSESINKQIAGVQMSRGELMPSSEQIEQLCEKISQTEQGLIICGPQVEQAGFAEAVTSLAKITGFPIMADALSGVRFGEHTETKGVTFLAGYENYLEAAQLAQKPMPQLILRFGNLPISSALADYLDRSDSAFQIQITKNGRWRDDRFRTNQVIWAQPTRVCQELVSRLTDAQHNRASNDWVNDLVDIETHVWKRVADLDGQTDFEGRILTDVVDWLPSKSALYIGNSLPVRHLDQFVAPNSKKISVFANRGASGIDGIISSALGAASVLESRLVLVIGDLSFYHDLTGLMAIKRYGIKATIILINNNGGGLFYRLPIADFDPPFSELFLTPHDLDFEPVVRMFGAMYTKVEDRESFQLAFAQSLELDITTVIEIPTNSLAYEKNRVKFVGKIHEKYQKIQR